MKKYFPKKSEIILELRPQNSAEVSSTRSGQERPLSRE
jgi:hypothetical protein